jgi:hypothetical protein
LRAGLRRNNDLGDVHNAAVNFRASHEHLADVDRVRILIVDDRDECLSECRGLMEINRQRDKKKKERVSKCLLFFFFRFFFGTHLNADVVTQQVASNL